MKIEVRCVAVVRVGLEGLMAVRYRHEFEDTRGGKYRVLLDAPKFTPGNKYTITID